MRTSWGSRDSRPTRRRPNRLVELQGERAYLEGREPADTRLKRARHSSGGAAWDDAETVTRWLVRLSGVLIDPSAVSGDPEGQQRLTANPMLPRGAGNGLSLTSASTDCRLAVATRAAPSRSSRTPERHFERGSRARRAPSRRPPSTASLHSHLTWPTLPLASDPFWKTNGFT